MNEKKNLEKIRGLLESVATRNTPFFNKCSETKILAYSNPGEAFDRYRHIAHQALEGSEAVLASVPKCREKYLTAKSMLDKEALSPDLIIALNSLRTTYLDEILKPAVKLYLSDQRDKPNDVETLYEKIFTLDGLIEVAQFFDRMDSL